MIISDKLWKQLIVLREKIRNNNDDILGITYDIDAFKLISSSSQIGLSDLVLLKKSLKRKNYIEESVFNEKLFLSYPINNNFNLEALRLYLPIIFAGELYEDRPFIFVHIAQSIDGKISTNCGHSKWIGNTENLHHAHRLRAIFDGVMVGGNTISCDLPSLNVRHVEGKNPTRILLSNYFKDFDLLPIVEGMDTFLLRNNGEDVLHPSITKSIQYAMDENSIFDMLLQLKLNGIKSLFIEGGAKTISSFLDSGLIDCIQMHIAPTIFGNGRPAFDLPIISNVNEGISLKNVFYSQMGDAIMVTGEPIV